MAFAGQNTSEKEVYKTCTVESAAEYCNVKL